MSEPVAGVYYCDFNGTTIAVDAASESLGATSESMLNPFAVLREPTHICGTFSALDTVRLLCIFGDIRTPDKMGVREFIDPAARILPAKKEEK